jgi:hypothetical protein
MHLVIQFARPFRLYVLGIAQLRLKLPRTDQSSQVAFRFAISMPRLITICDFTLLRCQHLTVKLLLFGGCTFNVLLAK